MKKTIIFIFTVSFLTVFSQTKKPNILWIVTEDISPTLAMYGDHIAKTPVLDKLAQGSIIYDNAYSPVGVCAPTRSSIITGMYPTSIGTMHMRTGKDTSGWGKRVYEKNPVPKRLDIENNEIPQYSSVIPSEVKCFTEYLRAVGYFCTNNSKTDYQFASPITAWDENGNNAHWRNRNENQPFFSVFNINLTHESKIWGHSNKPLTVDPKSVKVPPYQVDSEIARKDIARHYSNIELMDIAIGKIIAQLKDDGLYENTIIFFYSDHGGPLPREKRAIYDSGLKVPLLIKNVNSTTIGRSDQMISLIDLGPTLLSIAEINPPNYLQGNAFMGKYSKTENSYIFGSSDRFDGFTDRSRAIRTKEFLYVKNYFPDLIKYKDLAYRKQISMMRELLELNEKNELNTEQSIWFGTKTAEELYDVKKDPYQLHNLALSKDYKKTLDALRKIYTKHQKNNVDLGEISELNLLNGMWPNLVQPKTKSPIISYNNNKIELSCNTKGASIAYLISDNSNEKYTYDSHWKLYSDPINVSKQNYLYIIAERIGFTESDIKIIKIDNL